MTGNYKYKAFISYSHVDKKWGAWLHRRLEQFKFPQSFLRSTQRNSSDPYLLRPVFRDREELSVGHDLGAKIESALRQSECLIVICSPESARSHWVNEEILFFKQKNRNAKIFSVIVAGQPYSGDETECFPEALRFKVTSGGVKTNERAEPLAADLRESGDGKRLGLLKLVAGLVGTDLDALVQRDLKRNRQRVMAITLTSFALVSVMGALLINAVTARQEAEKRREVAEEQIEFMLTDLKDEVMKVGRLEALEIVGERAKSYYDENSETLKGFESKGRYGRVLQYLGEIELKKSNPALKSDENRTSAISFFEDAYTQLEALYKADRTNPSVIFDFGQAVFWRGNSYYFNGEHEKSWSDFQEYRRLAKELQKIEPTTERGLTEYSFASFNIAIMHYNAKNFPKAAALTSDILPSLEKASTLFPDSKVIKYHLADAYGWAADFFFTIEPEVSVSYRITQVDLLVSMNTDDAQKDMPHEDKYLTAISGYGRALIEVDECAKATQMLSEFLPRSARLAQHDPDNLQYSETYGWFCKHTERANKCLGRDGNETGSNFYEYCKI